MKYVLIAVSALMSAQIANASDYYRCTNVGGVDEYDIEINLKTKKAAFFDNDSWSVVSLKQTLFLKTFPPQTQYVFSGRDAYKSPMQIVFNQTRLSASVTENLGTSKENLMEAEGGCSAVRPSELNSGI